VEEASYAGGRREERLQNKNFNLLQLDSYFSHAVLVPKFKILDINYQ
jgi:hypothetical protein